MKKTRTLASAAGAVVLVTGAASFAVLGGGSANAAGNPSSAYGLELSIAGNAVVGADTVQVVSTDGSKVTDELLDVDPLNPLLSGGAVQVEAENDHAMANVTGLGVGDGLLAQLPSEVTTQLGTVCGQLNDALSNATGPLQDSVLGPILGGLQDVLDTVGDSTANSPIDLSLLGALDISHLTDLQLDGLCDVLSGDAKLIGLGTVVAECHGKTGTTVVEDGSALGLPLDIPVDEPNGKVSIPGLLTITANEQINNANGTFTVNALHINLLDQIDLVVASATCGKVTSDGGTNPTDAPTPTPVESHVPVTG